MQRKAVKQLVILIREGGRTLKAACITMAKNGAYGHSPVRIAHYTMVHYLTLSSASSARSTPRTLLEFWSVLGGMSLPMRQQKPCCGASCPAMVLPETCDPQGLPAPMPKKRVSIPCSLCHCEMEIIFTWLWLPYSFLLFIQCKILAIITGMIPVVVHSI